jgi:Domain of unknown function (DUF4178)
MTAPASRTAACPNCGAPVRFLWAQAVQTTCAYCKAVLVRHDVDLAVVGKQASFPETGSPIQIGTEGKWRGQRFLVVGRLAYTWDRGRWNEWHCRLTNGESAWLSDAQLEYAMTKEAKPDGDLPDPRRAAVGDSFFWGDHAYEVATKTQASYLGTEGELPFEFTSTGRNMFIDLQNDGGKLATVDYSGNVPVLYLGEYCDFESLEFTNLRTFEGW